MIFASPRVVLQLFLAIFLVSATAMAQNTINVPADQSTIQAAINAANPGDTVLVAPGTYSVNLNFLGKAITITSSGGAENTILQGGPTASVVQFVKGETQSSVLDGFTITQGWAPNGLGPELRSIMLHLPFAITSSPGTIYRVGPAQYMATTAHRRSSTTPSATMDSWK